MQDTIELFVATLRDSITISEEGNKTEFNLQERTDSGQNIKRYAIHGPRFLVEIDLIGELNSITLELIRVPNPYKGNKLSTKALKMMNRATELTHIPVLAKSTNRAVPRYLEAGFAYKDKRTLLMTNEHLIE